MGELINFTKEKEKRKKEEFPTSSQKIREQRSLTSQKSKDVISLQELYPEVLINQGVLLLMENKFDSALIYFNAAEEKGSKLGGFYSRISSLLKTNKEDIQLLREAIEFLFNQITKDLDRIVALKREYIDHLGKLTIAITIFNKYQNILNDIENDIDNFLVSDDPIESITRLQESLDYFLYISRDS